MQKLDQFLPEKEVRISDSDLPFITRELKQLDRQKKREYRRHKRSEKYNGLKLKYDELFDQTSRNYFNNIINSLMSVKPGKAYTLLKKLGSRPGESEDASFFTLPNHTKDNLTDQESADAIANYFAAVIQEYEPWNIDRHLFWVQELLSKQINYNDIPMMSEIQVWNKMNETRVTKSYV